MQIDSENLNITKVYSTNNISHHSKFLGTISTTYGRKIMHMDYYFSQF